MKFLFTLLFLAFAFTGKGQEFYTIESNGSDDYYAVGMSSDGQYIVGQVGDQHHLFVWKKGGAVLENDENRLDGGSQGGSNARGVSLQGQVAGISPNPDKYFDDPDWIFGGGESNIVTAAVLNYETNTWYYLPIVNNSDLLPGYGSWACAISDDGKFVTGAQNPGGYAYWRTAGYWKEGSDGNFTWTALTANASARTRGSLAKAVSGDGSIIGGFKSSSFVPNPVLWIDAGKTGNYVETAIQGVGSVEEISSNGKYAVVSLVNGEKGTANLYNLENETLTTISEQSSAALDVSDNGIVVGHWGALFYGTQMTGYNMSYGRHIEDGDSAFIFTEKMGLKALKSFFDENEITYPAGFDFKAATAISADGRIICGHGILNGKKVSFRAEIPPITGTGIFPARKFTIESPAYGSVRLSWEAVPEDTAFKGYKIYSGNGILITTTSANDISYTINNLADGTYSYYVVASYATKDAPATKTLTVTMGKKAFSGLFLEEFSYTGKDMGALRAAYWDVSQNTIDDSWYVKSESGLPPNAAFFLVPVGGEYNESLTSPYLDVTESPDLYLSFSIAIPGSNIPGTENQYLSVEIFDGSAWHSIENIPATGKSIFMPKKYDVSQYAGKENVRIRFRCHGNASGADLNWFIDNVELADGAHVLVEEAPLTMSAWYVKSEGNTHINWSDPRGHVSLRYMPSDTPIGGIGNSGETFIAANTYSSEDLKSFEGYKFTSISFFRTENPEPKAPITVEPDFRWFVSQGKNRLVDEPVINPQIGWNTLQLTNPVEIDATKPLYYGVEVVTHDVEDWPVGVAHLLYWDSITYQAAPTSIINGRGNIYSEDQGATWKKISDSGAGYEYDLFCIRATLAQDVSNQPKERLIGYRVLRDGVNLKGEGTLTILNSCTDTVPLPLNKQVCYEIQAFYTSQVASEGVSDCFT
ncbi:MAG: hypothetical protein LBB85_09105, partial [Dysgonamonadaceae bacterium]|nr:hypothetical protein [Dysgonamonadaceae bacterium]